MTTTPAVYQRRWLAWCRATGCHPGMPNRPDTVIYNSYLRWLIDRRREWRIMTGRDIETGCSLADREAFDSWLSASAEVERAALNGGEGAP